MKTNKLSTILLYSIIFVIIVIAIYPLLLAVSVSFSSSESVMMGYSLIPHEFSVDSYRLLFNNFSGIWRAYFISIALTICGVVLSLIVTILTAYPLSVRDFRYKSVVSFIIFFTMMFSGGTISYYILVVKYLNLKNTFLVLFITTILAPSNVFLLRTFFEQVPESIYESARIDGAGEYSILIRMAMPLALPGITTIGLFILLQYWNDYITGMLFIDKQDMYPLQLLLYRYSSYIQNLDAGNSSMPADESLLIAMCVVATLPMLVVLMFFQKYFVRGLTAGAVKS